MPSEAHKLSFLPVLASVVLVIGSLYWARAVFVPLALSLMLTFLLQPVVAVLHRWGLGYAPAAGLVVLLLAFLIGAIGWVAVTQLSNLASELPRYQDNLKQKIEDLQHASQGGVFGKIQESVAELSRNFQKRQLPATGPQEPIAVTPPWSSLILYVPSFLGFLVDAGLVLVLLLFMLIAHRDLRDRLFRLVGYGRVTVTTKALDEAGQRISRALRMQAVVNGTYGSAVGLGLFCLGVPYALMWGLFAGMLRFIPYIGPAVGALMPIALSMAVFAGWVKPLLVGGLFVLLEIATNALLEPLLYGRGAGVSQVVIASPTEEDTATVLPPKVHILGCPAHDEADELALQMLQHVLDPRRFEIEVTRAGLLAAEVLSLVEQSTPTLVCIGLVPPGGFAQTRYLCKRLRARCPTLPIVVGCWSGTTDAVRKPGPTAPR